MLTLAFAAISAGLASSHYGWINTLCDVYPFPHAGFRITSISECPSSIMFQNGLSSAALLLVCASLLVRIVLSRCNTQA